MSRCFRASLANGSRKASTGSAPSPSAQLRHQRRGRLGDQRLIGGQLFGRRNARPRPDVHRPQHPGPPAVHDGDVDAGPQAKGHDQRVVEESTSRTRAACWRQRSACRRRYGSVTSRPSPSALSPTPDYSTGCEVCILRARPAVSSTVVTVKSRVQGPCSGREGRKMRSRVLACAGSRRWVEGASLLPHTRLSPAEAPDAIISQRPPSGWPPEALPPATGPKCAWPRHGGPEGCAKPG